MSMHPALKNIDFYKVMCSMWNQQYIKITSPDTVDFEVHTFNSMLIRKIKKYLNIIKYTINNTTIAN